MASKTAVNAAERDAERKKYRENLKTALDEEDDPLAVYDRFVQWTVKAYGERDPNSGLLELLEEATKAFKEDPVYKSDLRYLKLWTLYASQVERSGGLSIYRYLLSNEIGTSFSLLYEKYAALLEEDGRQQDAENIYRKGIKRQARPTERLKNRYKEFHSRTGTSSTTSSSLKQSSTSSAGSSSSSNPLRKNPLQKHSSQSRSVSASSSGTALGSGNSTLVSLQSSREARYAAMLAPPAPGKRPEKLRFNLGLLFSEGTEYSIQEARARSMGLLGKKWGPPPASEFRRFGTSNSSYSMPVDFNDDGQKSTRVLDSRRKSMLGGAEPTVTINTKEALADVFGMYNSPEKTRLIPGSKHAPLKKLEPMTPSLPLRAPSFNENRENDDPSKGTKTPTATAFKPFVDENAQSVKATPGPAKFMPFIDPEANKTPSVTSRPALSLKASAPLSTPSSSENPLRSKPLLDKLHPVTEAPEPVFSNPVFTPVEKPQQALRDVATDDLGKPTPRPALAERAKSHGDLLSSSTSEPFKPFVDEDANSKTPFAGKVFSRPPGSTNVFTPKTPSAGFTPFVDAGPAFTPKPAFTAFKDAPSVFTPSVDPQHVQEEEEVEEPHPVTEPPSTSFLTEDEEMEGPPAEGPISESTSTTSEEYQDEYYQDDQTPQQEHYEAPLNGESEEYYEEVESYQEVEAPLGGRFGRFNVMTPITERTFEFTTTTTVRTPSGGAGSRRSSEDSLFPQRDEQGAVLVAEQLAAELREDELDVPGRPALEPFKLSNTGNESMSESMIEVKAGSLSLGDTLTLNTQFRPPNPCSQFDPAVVRSLLSRVLPDAQSFDFLDRDSNQLEALQKFSKKSRKSSDGAVFSLRLVDHRFSVTEKVGEGGFGAVFRAQDIGTRAEDEDTDDELEDDDDEENASIVAVKVVKPRNQWEYRILRRLHSVLPSSLRRSVISPQALYVFRDESYLILEYCSQGTLLNVVNGAAAAGVSQQGGCLDELLVFFFAIELLRLLESMHEIGFIHGDLKIDNCLLRLEEVPGGASTWTSVYQPNGEGGWCHKGLKVIDFGRTIDTRLFPIGQQFVADWSTDERDCFEARENRPFTYQTDYFGLAGIIYCMLFGKYMQISAVVSAVAEDGRSYYKVGTPFKRYWQSDIWHRLFKTLLNPCQVKLDGTLPLCNELANIREEMERWLQANCNRTSGTLKGLLKKVEVSCYTR